MNRFRSFGSRSSMDDSMDASFFWEQMERFRSMGSRSSTERSSDEEERNLEVRARRPSWTILQPVDSLSSVDTSSVWEGRVVEERNHGVRATPKLSMLRSAGPPSFVDTSSVRKEGGVEEKRNHEVKARPKWSMLRSVGPPSFMDASSVREGGVAEEKRNHEVRARPKLSILRSAVSRSSLDTSPVRKGRGVEEERNHEVRATPKLKMLRSAASRSSVDTSPVREGRGVEEERNHEVKARPKLSILRSATSPTSVDTSPVRDGQGVEEERNHEVKARPKLSMMRSAGSPSFIDTSPVREGEVVEEKRNHEVKARPKWSMLRSAASRSSVDTSPVGEEGGVEEERNNEVKARPKLSMLRSAGSPSFMDTSPVGEQMERIRSLGSRSTTDSSSDEEAFEVTIMNRTSSGKSTEPSSDEEERNLEMRARPRWSMMRITTRHSTELYFGEEVSKEIASSKDAPEHHLSSIPEKVVEGAVGDEEGIEISDAHNSHEKMAEGAVGDEGRIEISDRHNSHENVVEGAVGDGEGIGISDTPHSDEKVVEGALGDEEEGIEISDTYNSHEKLEEGTVGDKKWIEPVKKPVKKSLKKHRSQRKKIKNVRVLVGACFCMAGIFFFVVAAALSIQNKKNIHDDGLESSTPKDFNWTAPSPGTSGPTLSPAPTTTVQPTKSPTFRPSAIPSDMPSLVPSNIPSIKPSASYVPTNKPSESPSESPSSTPSIQPTTSFQPTLSPTRFMYPRRAVMQWKQSLRRGQFVASPSGEYRVGLSASGEFVLLNLAGDIIWKADAARADFLLLQADGNLVLLDTVGNTLWSTATSTSSASLFLIDDGGMIGLVQTFRGSTESTYVWMKGVPHGTYTGAPEGSEISYPVRATFYYPWYPETWTVGEQQARYAPDVGWYHSGDPSIVRSHIDQLEYGRFDLAVAAWFGIDTNNDIARITQLLEKTEEAGSPLKWALYYEMFEETRTVEEIQRDLEYIKKWFAWHPSYAHIGGRPVIFIYQSKGCDIIQNWVDASQGEWYLVPKVFMGYSICNATLSPGKYHQYAPAEPIKQYDGHSFTISPGFWKANETEPRLARLNQTTWCDNVQKMVDSKAPWQLVTTFNEAGEGTSIESSKDNWPSASGYGMYLDCLQDIY